MAGEVKWVPTGPRSPKVSEKPGDGKQDMVEPRK